ncbi:MAG: hypothetical protein ACRDQD_04170 [Nocardioidaceae bacterium]
MSGQHCKHFEWNEGNGMIRAALLGILAPTLPGLDGAALVTVIEHIVSEMDTDSKVAFAEGVIEPALRGEAPADFSILRGPAGTYEVILLEDPE